MQAQEESHRLDLGNSVHFMGYLTEAELFCCYKSASVFVFPSLYEGFGLPPLEAMSFGLPVVSSNRTAIPEVLGQAALYVNPESPEAMADGIMKVLTDPGLSSQLSAAGRRRAKTFSVLDMGIRHLELYESLLA
jgi:glycosyltransferase involved in cell wall biosynthesis